MEKRIVLFLGLSFAVLLGHAALMRWIYGPPRPVAQQQAQQLAEGGDGSTALDAATEREGLDAGNAASDNADNAAALAADQTGSDRSGDESEPAASADTADAIEAMTTGKKSAGEAPSEGEPGDIAAGDATAANAVAEDSTASGEDAEGIQHGEAEQLEEAEPQTRYLTLGSADPDSPYRMLVVLTSHGAAVEAIELNSPRFRDLEFRGGYLGYLLPIDNPDGPGTRLRVVGPGTPAAEAGLRAGDVVLQLDDEPVENTAALISRLDRTRPGQQVRLTIERDGQQQTVTARLARKPLNVIQPEADAPPSLRLTLARLDEAEFEPSDENDDEVREIAGVALQDANWEVVEANTEQVVFRRLARRGKIEVIKRYRLEPTPEAAEDATAPAYHLDVTIELRNRDKAPHRVAYALDGPNGLPTEGWWYASKISRSWGGVGLRDVAIGQFDGNYVNDTLFSCQKVADGETFTPNPDLTLAYIGVDAQYFSAILIPQKEDLAEVWFDDYRALRVTPPPEPSKKRLTNTSCRLVSTTQTLEPSGPALVHRYRFFTGPKRPKLLAQYGLDELVYYGWFGWVSRPMLSVLHFFHSYLTFGNYGLAIILLTVVVRSAMFPLSRKQALNAQKMQELQPELKRIAEKYKKDMEKRTKAQQELFRKHNYNPLGGCLLMFFQLPIFIGLYRSLMVDVELRQAPLLSEAIRWCSNLAAPDMLWDWSGVMPGMVIGWLGPYLNVLPLVTVGLFLWQQKMFMPPATDEQTQMQQQMMKFMMLFMGILFFKVASGLCLYFIASSIWGIAERKILPRTTPGTQPGAAAGTSPAKTSVGAAAKAIVGNNGSKGSPAPRKKLKGRR